MKIGSIKTNAAALEAGVWVDDLPGTDLALRVRSQSSPVVEALLGKLSRAVSLEDRDVDGRLKPEKRREIADRILAEAVLVDWKNFTEDDGTPIPFTAARALEFLSDPDMVEFRGLVEHAAELAVGRARAVVVDALGNSKAPRAGA